MIDLIGNWKNFVNFFCQNFVEIVCQNFDKLPEF
jgi:hypothetical protein